VFYLDLFGLCGETVLLNTAKTMGKYGIKWESKTLLDSYYANGLILLGKNAGENTLFLVSFESLGLEYA